MQVKKEEVREAILIAGEKEILKNGFLGASVRNIVKEAGTTIGNFYNYFGNKEAMFDELVKDVYNQFEFMVKNHDNIENKDYLLEVRDIEIWRKELDEVSKYFMPVFSDKFLLLIKYSKGTKYENIRFKFVTMIKEHFNEHMDNINNCKVNRDFSFILAEQFVHGITEILEKYKDNNKRKELICEHILFYCIGTMSFLNMA